VATMRAWVPGFGALILVLAGLPAAGDEVSTDATEPPPYEEFLVLPLRIHILSATDLPEIDCGLTDDDIARIVGKVNGIWNKAGVHFGLESIVREPAVGQAKFRLTRDLNGAPPLGLFRILLPSESRRFDGLHVYYIHKFSVNGVYLGDDFAIVQETAKLRPVEGGIDEPIPRVTAHELGHALGLKHRQDRTNLLASGTTGTLLNAEEVQIAREKALNRKGAFTVESLREKARKEASDGDRETALRLWTWLGEIPGDDREEARRELDRLKQVVDGK
jgi:hypothetical protein